MKLIFLDIDGVLATRKTYRECKSWNTGEPLKDHAELLCPKRTKLLSSFLEEKPDIQVVISSTWRLLVPWDHLMDCLERRGFPVGRVIGRTPDSPDGYRGEEIQAYLHDFPDATIAILDDDADMKPYMGRLIQTTMVDGLQPKHIQRLDRLLNKKT